MKTFLRTLSILGLSIVFLLQVSFARVADQRILPLSEIFPDGSYETFVNKYKLTSADIVNLFFDEDILRILSYLRTISNSDSQFFSLVDAIHYQHTVSSWDINKSRVEKLIDDAFPNGVNTNTSSNDDDALRITTNRRSPAQDQRVNITINVDNNYRGYLDFYVSYRSSNAGSRGGVSSSSYFTAHHYFDEGYDVIAADGGYVSLSSFIKFNRGGYFRVYVEDEEGRDAYVEFDVSGDTNGSSSSTSAGMSTVTNSTYSYSATNCKKYTIQYLDSGIYTSADFISRQYFAGADYIERYIDSKNPGDCITRSSYATNQTFSNTSNTQHIAPNGKVYYIETEGDSYYSPQMGTKKLFSSIAELREYISQANPLSDLWSHTRIESEEHHTTKVTSYRDVVLYRTDKGWMSYLTPVGKYFSTAQELKDYLGG